jgi:hypothetical protein
MQPPAPFCEAAKYDIRSESVVVIPPERWSHNVSVLRGSTPPQHTHTHAHARTHAHAHAHTHTHSFIVSTSKS